MEQIIKDSTKPIQNIVSRTFTINGKITSAFTVEECKELYKTLKQIDGIEETKHYLGDVKWVLYQYICDIGEQCTFICGSYAYYKLARYISDNHDIQNNPCSFPSTKNLDFNIEMDSICVIDLNGEIMEVLRSLDIDKKKLEIHTKENGKQVELYFA